MNFLADVVGAGFKGALIKFFRLLFFAIIILIVVYVVGIFTNKKASALTYNGTDYTALTNTSNNQSGGVSVPSGATYSGTITINYTNNKNTPVDSDLIGYRFNAFNVEYYGSNGSCFGSITARGSGTVGGSAMDDIIWYCDSNVNVPPQSSFMSISANIVLNNGTDGNVEFPCWMSSEFENTFVCTNDRTSNVVGLNVYIRYKTPKSFDYNLQMSGLRFKLDNSETSIVQQQQQTQQTITDSDTTTSQANSTNALTGIKGTMETKLKGTNELTQMVMAPLTILTNVAGSSCQPITWHIPLVDYDATIPCMSTIYNEFFSTILALFSTIITGIFAYRTIVKLVSTIKDSLDAENDKLEVLDL